MTVLNIVIGNPLVDPKELLASDETDWLENEKLATFFTETRFLPAVMKEAGIVPSTGEVRRNKPELVRTLDQSDCFWVEWGKKKIYVVVGEE